MSRSSRGRPENVLGTSPVNLLGTSLERQIKTSPGRQIGTCPGRQIGTSPERSNRIFRGHPGTLEEDVLRTIFASWVVCFIHISQHIFILVYIKLLWKIYYYRLCQGFIVLRFIFMSIDSRYPAIKTRTHCVPFGSIFASQFSCH